MVRFWGNHVRQQAERQLAEFYPNDSDGSTPIAYMWARTIQCEGPGCGAEVPLMGTLWLARKGERSVGLRLVPTLEKKLVSFEIVVKRAGRWVNQADGQPLAERPHFEGTVRRGSATCPVCGYTTPIARLRAQLKARRGGANDARLFCVVTIKRGQNGRSYRLPAGPDLELARQAAVELERRKRAHLGPLSLVPDEEISPNEIRRISVPLYGMATWGDLYAPRQMLVLSTFSQLIDQIGREIRQQVDPGFSEAVQTCLALALDRNADQQSSLVTWLNTIEAVAHTFVRQAIGMSWDYVEPNVFSQSGGNWDGAVEWVAKVCEHNSIAPYVGRVESDTATACLLPDNCAQAFITDPPYYDAVPYAHLSDYFYVWLRRSVGNAHAELFKEAATPKYSNSQLR